jgi:hypothetical protein
MRGGFAFVMLVAVTPAPAVAQWDIGLEVSTTHYRGSSHDTTASNGPEAFRPANATTLGLRLDRGIGRMRVGFHVLYGKVGLMASGPGLTLIDNSTGQVLEGQVLFNFQVVGIGSSGAVKLELGPSLHLWKSADQTRTRIGAIVAPAYEWPIARRFSGAIRVETMLSKSWFDPGDLPAEYERRATWRYGVGLGLRYRL